MLNLDVHVKLFCLFVSITRRFLEYLKTETKIPVQSMLD
jgi:hypothetical protein